MGFFSWITQDTGRSIPSSHSNREPFKVIMLDNKGNKWVEKTYEGYGEFGGKDFYELLSEMNGVVCKLQGKEYTEYMRGKGIDLVFDNNPSGDNTPGVLYPNLVESETWTWKNQELNSCPDQGYFYSDDDEDDDEDDWFLDEH